MMSQCHAVARSVTQCLAVTDVLLHAPASQAKRLQAVNTALDNSKGHIPQQLASVLKAMIHEEPLKRPSLEDLLRCDYIGKYVKFGELAPGCSTAVRVSQLPSMATNSAVLMCMYC